MDRFRTSGRFREKLFQESHRARRWRHLGLETLMKGKHSYRLIGIEPMTCHSRGSRAGHGATITDHFQNVLIATTKNSLDCAKMKIIDQISFSTNKGLEKNSWMSLEQIWANKLWTHFSKAKVYRMIHFGVFLSKFAFAEPKIVRLQWDFSA